MILQVKRLNVNYLWFDGFLSFKQILQLPPLSLSLNRLFSVTIEMRFVWRLFEKIVVHRSAVA